MVVFITKREEEERRRAFIDGVGHMSSLLVAFLSLFLSSITGLRPLPSSNKRSDMADWRRFGRAPDFSDGR